MSLAIVRKRIDKANRRAAKIRRSYGRDRSTWPPIVLQRFERLVEEHKHLLAIIERRA